MIGADESRLIKGGRMVRMAQYLKNLKDHPVTVYIKNNFSYITGAIHTSTPFRITAALSASLATAASVFALVILHAPFTTDPVELLGCFTYYTDLNITNRLAGIALFMLVSMVTFLVFCVFFFHTRNRENEAHAAVGYSLLPGLFWISSIILQPQSTFDMFWLYLSTGLCWIAVFSFLREQKNDKLAGSTAVILFAFGLSFFVPPALMAFFKSPLFWKLPVFAEPQLILTTISFLGAWIEKLQWLPPLFVLLVYLFFPKRNVLLWIVLYPIQLGLLFFFCLILPGAFLVDGVFTQYFRAAPILFIVVLPLIIVGIWDCTRRCFFHGRSPFSPFPFLALLIYALLQNSPVPGFTRNLFEFGSRFPEFWVSFQGWESLFKHTYISYGLWDYAQFLFGWLFSGQHTAAVSTYGASLFQAFILILEYSASASLLPAGLAFMFCLIAGVGPQSVVLFYICILFNPRLIDRPAVWIAVWIILSSFLPFARIPQGTICVVASLPAFLWQTAKLFRINRKMFWKTIGFLGAVGFVMIVWPLGGYFWGLLRIYSETAMVNTPWAANVWRVDNVPFLNVLLGNAVLIMPLVSLLVALLILRRGRQPLKIFVAFFLCSFTLIYIFASISYGFSRTDWTPYLRQFQVLMTILLPMLASIIVYVPSRIVLTGCIGALLCFGSLWPVNIPSPANFLQTSKSLPVLAASDIQDASKFGLPNLGVGRFPAGYLEEESTLKQALDRALAPDETFLDLTIEGLHYFESQRKLITEYPVYYVYPGDAPQLRAVEQLSSQNVRVSLLEPDYIDDSPSPLRTYYLYRYALLHGLPWEITPTKTLLLPEEYFSRMGLTPPSPTQILQMLDKQFPLTNFEYLPSVWGRGYQTFAGEFLPVRDLTTLPAKVDNGGTSIEYELQPPLRGVDAGLLVLGIEMPENIESGVEVRWVDQALPSEVNKIQFIARNGTNIIPVDASPRWLLAQSIISLTITPSYFSESQLNIKNLWQSLSTIPPVSLISPEQVNGSILSGGNMVADNNDPSIYYSIPDALAGQNLLMHVVLTVPPGADIAQVFYRTAATSFNETDSARVPVTDGINEIYFTIPAEMTHEELRFDPGAIAGNYVVSMVEAKPFKESFNISTAALLQRPNIDK
jgi:hypothetical protein